MGNGSLIVVGTGYGGSGQVSRETAVAIAGAEKMFFSTADRATTEWIYRTNPGAESLQPFYAHRTDRRKSYVDMVEHIMIHVRRGKNVCVAFYGHPGVAVFPAHAAIQRARAEGFAARMLPAISALDCLFADLGLDPTRRGLASFEATDFLIRRRRIDPTVPLVLWQVGALGRVGRSGPVHGDRLQILVDALLTGYPEEHQVVIYQAATDPGGQPDIVQVRLDQLPAAGVSAIATLYVPPARDTPVDVVTARRLGIPEGYLTGMAAGRRSPSAHA